MTRVVSACLLLVLTASAALSNDAWTDDARRALLDGVRRIAAPGSPAAVVCFGPDVLPLVAAPHDGRPGPGVVVAAARLGAARLVAFAHDGYLEGEHLALFDTSALLQNSVRWAGGDRRGDVGVRRRPAAQKALKDAGLSARPVDGVLDASGLSRLSVLVLAPGDLAPAEVDAVRGFVAGGGGVIAASCGWGWQQLNPGRRLSTDHDGNQVFGAAGIAWADVAVTDDDAGYVPTPIAPETNAHAALALLTAGRASREQVAGAMASLLLAVRSIPPDDRLLRPLLAKLRERRAPIPTERDALVAGEDDLDRLRLALELDLGSLPSGQTPAHPAAQDFPGQAPGRAVERTVEVSCGRPRWHSTGLFLRAGDPLTVEVPPGATRLGLSLRVGCHTDTLWHLDTWSRAPELTRRVPLDAPTVRVATAFGGLVYVEVPEGAPAETVEVRLGGAIAAPRFVLGRTSPAEWKKLRAAPGPWAELESRWVILTVPSEVVRKIGDPTPLLELWDRILEADADLAGISPQRAFPERIAADRQISAGYMHSGYPIMTHLDAAERMVDLKTMRGGEWGLFHELGHNHQAAEWTFDGTGEVTCNLFTMFVLERVCGVPWTALPDVLPAARAAKVRAYVSGGRRFDAWKADPFLALLFYRGLVEGFGWDAFKQVFRTYRALPDSERPRSDDEKRDRWLITFSRAVEKDLGPYFAAWGVPVSSAARSAVEPLPDWMPDDPVLRCHQ